LVPGTRRAVGGDSDLPRRLTRIDPHPPARTAGRRERPAGEAIATPVPRVPMRYGPWLVALVAAVLVVWSDSSDAGSGGGGVQPIEVLLATTPPDPADETCERLLALSEQAAGLTGSLALVAGPERPGRAGTAAEQVRRLAGQAASVAGGEELAGVLVDLAEALEGYARGTVSAEAGGVLGALAGVREASARNARLRATYGERCGGEGR
jgi:hypothetical protein